MALRIPKYVYLPFGYRITIVLLKAVGFKMHGTEDCDGFWNCDNKTIYIRRSLPVTRRRYILAHVLVHACLDWQHKYMDQGAAKN